MLSNKINFESSWKKQVLNSAEGICGSKGRYMASADVQKQIFIETVWE